MDDIENDNCWQSGEGLGMTSSDHDVFRSEKDQGICTSVAFGNPEPYYGFMVS